MSITRKLQVEFQMVFKIRKVEGDIPTLFFFVFFLSEKAVTVQKSPFGNTNCFSLYKIERCM